MPQAWSQKPCTQGISKATLCTKVLGGEGPFLPLPHFLPLLLLACGHVTSTLLPHMAFPSSTPSEKDASPWI